MQKRSALLLARLALGVTPGLPRAAYLALGLTVGLNVGHTFSSREHSATMVTRKSQNTPQQSVRGYHGHVSTQHAPKNKFLEPKLKNWPVRNDPCRFSPKLCHTVELFLGL